MAAPVVVSPQEKKQEETKKEEVKKEEPKKKEEKKKSTPIVPIKVEVKGAWANRVNNNNNNTTTATSSDIAASTPVVESPKLEQAKPVVQVEKEETVPQKQEKSQVKPEVNTQVKSEVKEVKPEVKVEVKPQVKPEVIAEVKQVKTEVKEVKPEVKEVKLPVNQLSKKSTKVKPTSLHHLLSQNPSLSYFTFLLDDIILHILHYLSIRDLGSPLSLHLLTI